MTDAWAYPLLLLLPIMVTVCRYSLEMVMHSCSAYHSTQHTLFVAGESFGVISPFFRVVLSFLLVLFSCCFCCFRFVTSNHRLLFFFFFSVLSVNFTPILQVISPVDGVTDEHFVVWMRTAALSTLRNLYGRIEHDVVAPAEITFNITASEYLCVFVCTSLTSADANWPTHSSGP